MDEWRPHSRGLRRFFYFAILLLGSVGIFLFLLSESTDRLFAWTIEPPLTARAVGAWLLALTAGLVVTLWENDWTRIRVAAPTYVAMALLQFVALARYSDTLDWSGLGAWLYVGYLASVLLLGLYGIRRSWGAASAAPTPAPATGSR